MSVKEEEDQKAKERSVAYRTMMGLWSFQDFLGVIKSIKEQAVKDLYEMSDAEATVARLGQIRGTLKAVDKIERELDYILHFKETV